ncbi:hypothetical protein L1987_06806 [Smallanthus sonchifolius]|uniref:Uncharacterized protein n=1 Tax=Smallanthus sonchifolius TaxID=185202 RepID=A0ACB9JZ87_9ASTR|nr:hypothetical protein L1987_06806 [Smallanthus sonchifolius]
MICTIKCCEDVMLSKEWNLQGVMQVIAPKCIFGRKREKLRSSPSQVQGDRGARFEGFGVGGTKLKPDALDMGGNDTRIQEGLD